MDRIIAIDPGVHLCAYAAIRSHINELYGLKIVKDTIPAFDKKKHKTKESDIDILMRQFYEIGMLKAPTIVIVEHPVIYPMERQKGDPNDIVRLAAVAGAVGAACAMGAPNYCSLEFVEPRRWKGTVPKHIHNERTRERCPEAVALVESIPKGQRNHVWDAIALATWKAERIF